MESKLSKISHFEVTESLLLKSGEESIPLQDIFPSFFSELAISTYVLLVRVCVTWSLTNCL